MFLNSEGYIAAQLKFGILDFYMQEKYSSAGTIQFGLKGVKG